MCSEGGGAVGGGGTAAHGLEVRCTTPSRPSIATLPAAMTGCWAQEEVADALSVGGTHRCSSKSHMRFCFSEERKCEMPRTLR